MVSKQCLSSREPADSSVSWPGAAQPNSSEWGGWGGGWGGGVSSSSWLAFPKTCGGGALPFAESHKAPEQLVFVLLYVVISIVGFHFLTQGLLQAQAKGPKSSTWLMKQP